MSVQKGSAEIFELDGARARLRGSDLDPNNFLAVGPYLEAVREQQGLSLAAVSDRTHIKAAYIEAIERMALDALPSKAFATGFVRTYAEALGLEPGPIIDRFKGEAGFSAHRRDAADHKQETEPARAPAQPAEPARLSLVAVLAILGFMVWCLFLVTHPGPDAVKRPLKLDGVPLAEGPLQARPVEEAAPAPVVHSAAREETQAAARAFTPEAEPPLPVIVEASVIDRIEPVYPPICESAAAPVETVDIAFSITPEGAVVSERIVASTNPCFDRAALNAVKRWRFSPRTIDGAPRPAFEQRASFAFTRPS